MRRITALWYNFRMGRCGSEKRKINVVLRGGGDEAAAVLLAERLGTEVLRGAEPEGLAVIFDEGGASLAGRVATAAGRSVSLRPDFSEMLPRIRPDALSREMLVRAAKIKGRAPRDITVTDATAGLGGDSFILAAAGYNVVMYENDPVIAALLRDALRRAAEVPALRGAAGRMELREEDSIDALSSDAAAADIVYLDPMFPDRKKSGAVGKKFQLLQQLERPCESGRDLLAAATGAARVKVVIKRPLGGEPLGGRRPDYTLKGKTVRFDCIAVNEL